MAKFRVFTRKCNLYILFYNVIFLTVLFYSFLHLNFYSILAVIFFVYNTLFLHFMSFFYVMK